jgi:peptide/nickel transport system substrate-binding protein
MYAAIIGQKTDHSWYLWEDVEAEMLANRAAIESDPALRQQMFDTLHERMTAWTPTIGLYNHFVFTATAKSVKGFRPWAMGLSRFWDVSR